MVNYEIWMAGDMAGDLTRIWMAFNGDTITLNQLGVTNGPFLLSQKVLRS